MARPTLRLSEESIKTLCQRLGYSFHSPFHLQHALTHSSAKTPAHPSNERLEFFGDAVLGFIVTEHIYHRYPDFPEGEMTRLKSALVSRETLAAKAQALGLDEYMLAGKGIPPRDQLPKSILANLFEAVVAAIFLDGGTEPARKFILGTFTQEFEVLIGRHVTRNYKSALQQLAQSRLGVTPTYAVVSESGPDHDKRFSVAAIVNDRQYGVGDGSSKKDAEQTAARIALKELLATLDLGDDAEAMLLELPDEEDEGDIDLDDDDDIDAAQPAATGDQLA